MYSNEYSPDVGKLQEGGRVFVFQRRFEQALSLERFGRYLDWAAGDGMRAIELYALNTRISESLYTPLQMLEVALRNRIHAVMTEARHENWFYDESVLLGKWQPDQLAKAIEEVREGRREPTPGRIVAALTFSFWTAMFGKEYETCGRPPCTASAAARTGKVSGARISPARSRRYAPCGIAWRTMNPSSSGTYRSTTGR